MLGFDGLTAAGLLLLAGNTIQCTIPKAPEIVVNPLTAPVQYEYNMTSEQLGQFKVSTVSPYAPGTDTTTGGLRHDRPRIKTEIKWGVMTYPSYNVSCVWYDNITVTIDLSPKIYIAKDTTGRRCRDAILEHEMRHVAVDREVINQYARDIGLAVKQAVDVIGPMGPFNADELESVRQNSGKHIEAAVDSRTFVMMQEMARRQAAVDSLQEYERISKVCEEERR